MADTKFKGRLRSAYRDKCQRADGTTPSPETLRQLPGSETPGSIRCPSRAGPAEAWRTNSDHLDTLDDDACRIESTRRRGRGEAQLILILLPLPTWSDGSMPRPATGGALANRASATAPVAKPPATENATSHVGDGTDSFAMPWTA